MLMWVVRGMLVVIEVMTAYNLSDAWNADLVTGDAYRISLILIMGISVITFILTLFPEDEEVDEKNEWTIKGQKAFMDKVENFEVKGETEDED